MVEANTGEVPVTSFDSIIPTGWLTAYGRTFTDIPYSQEMFDELEAIRIASGSTETLDVMKDTKLAPQFEARHKLLNGLIAQTGIKQVIEIAAGLSTRGLEMTSNDSVDYVEVDLPAMVADKRKIITDLENKGAIPKRPNLYIEAGSATEADDLLKATSHFNSSEPIVVVNEGLLRYLGFEDKTKYADNVKALLMKFGGVWITSDISLPKIIYKENDVMADRRKRISEITGVNVADNLFKDEDDAKKFFEGLGFDVESHSFLEVTNELTAPAKLNMPTDYVEAINGSAVVFVMRLNSKV
ncbi:MAG TPA: class I SAM-dependent methyltransferase [Candidatus Saccharimonadales bacterium]|nr:class I SAM-dependent methyltransferase [Candidatus Saccharimonadales bacterium]